MKCRYCKDKAIKSIDVTHDPNFGAGDDDDVFFREEEVIYDSQGTFRPRADGDDDEVVFHRDKEEESGEEEKAEVFVCEDHHRLWELSYGGKSEGEVKLEELKPEEREELEEATQEVLDEIEQIKERIRKKEEKGT